MKSLFLFIVISIIYNISAPRSSEELLKQMYDRYHNKWFHVLTFSQTTENYRNDSLIKTSTWYETIMYPDKFRIDFEDKKNGDAVIFRNDSAYDFRKGKLTSSKAYKNDLTFLLGGLYFYSFNDILNKLKAFHYDLNKFHQDKWKGKEVYVIGSDKQSEKLNQLWIDKENLVLVRLLKFDEKEKEEALFENHIRLGEGWSERACIFYVDDHLVQKEYYHNCIANSAIDSLVFEPSLFGRVP
ncbi:MAG TPA: hypothetical protein VMI12_16635 [Puia sp.]|nr:hypothetical protein [Puia sp.]